MMKAVFLKGEREVAIRQVPDPQCPKGGLLTRVDCSAICGSDLRAYRHGTSGPERIMGHETVGTVIEVGEGAEGFQVGDRVVDCPVTCGECSMCLAGRPNLCLSRGRVGGVAQGGFAELRPILASAVKGGFVIKIPDHVPSLRAMLTEPLACVVCGHERITVGPSHRVVIQGAGPIGLMHLVLCKMRGAKMTVAVDMLEGRLRHARDFGANHVILAGEVDPVQEILALTDGIGADVAIVACVSAKAQAEALAMLGRLGQALYFAGLPPADSVVSLDTNLIHYHELTVVGSRSSSIGHWRTALGMIESCSIDSDALVTHQVPLAEAEDAFLLADRGEGLKVAIIP